jgi:regulator of protease activity HflC (stomatin/prohibitin superfamily)
MLGLGFLKAAPTSFVIQFISGKAVREGPGLSFYYFVPRSVIVLVPLASVDVPFVFNEVSADFQEVTIQGQLTYRVTDPRRLAQMLDFSIQSNGRYVSDDPKKLGERLVSLTQVFASAITHRLTLRESLGAQDALVAEVMAKLKESPQVTLLGVEIMGLSILSIKPSPDTGKALEAEAREALLRRSDEAVYARRNAAVAQEQLIKESELNSEMAVEEKKRQIREAKMAADIAAEKQRAELLEQRVDNERKEADSKAYALTKMLVPLKGIDWHMLMALNADKADPRTTMAMAFRDLADQAQKIGQLNISPDLLVSILGETPKKK